MFERMFPQAYFFGYCLVTGQLYRAALMARDYVLFGCTERALWSVDYDFARWMLPRLVAYRYGSTNPYNMVGHPCDVTDEQFHEGLESAILACNLILQDHDGPGEDYGGLTGAQIMAREIKQEQEIDRGLAWLAQNIGSLWT